MHCIKMKGLRKNDFAVIFLIYSRNEKIIGHHPLSALLKKVVKRNLRFTNTTSLYPTLCRSPPKITISSFSPTERKWAVCPSRALTFLAPWVPACPLPSSLRRGDWDFESKNLDWLTGFWEYLMLGAGKWCLLGWFVGWVFSWFWWVLIFFWQVVRLIELFKDYIKGEY